jgi:hypothetical protein
MEFTLRSQNVKNNEYIAQVNPEIREGEQHLAKEFDNERIKLNKNYDQNLEELLDIFDNERETLRVKYEKSQETVKKLTTKLSEYKKIKEREVKELIKKLREPCHRCHDYETMFEDFEAINMEKEDAYNKIQNLEEEIIQMRALQVLDYSKTPTKENTLHYTNHIKDLNYDINDSFDFQMPNTPILSASPIHDPKIHQRYSEFQNKFIGGADKSPSVCRFSQKKSSVDTLYNTSTRKKLSDNFTILEGDEKSSMFEERMKESRQETKQVPLSNCSSACKNNTQSVNIKNWTGDDISALTQFQSHIDNTHNNTSPYAKDNVDIDKLIEKYIGPKDETKYDFPNKICTKEDLIDFNRKFVNEKPMASIKNSIDPSMNLYNSVNRTSESIPSNATTAKNVNKRFNFSNQSPVNHGMRNSESLISLRDNFDSMIAKQPYIKNSIATKSKKICTNARSKIKRKSTSISMVPKFNKNPNISMNVYQNQLHDRSQKENLSSITAHFHNKPNGYGNSFGVQIDSSKRCTDNGSILSNLAPTFASESYKASKGNTNYQRFIK